MTKPQLHFDISIPVTFLTQKKEAMTPSHHSAVSRAQEKRGERKLSY